MSDNALIRALRSFGQGASNAVASNVSTPVDGIAWLLRKGGLPIPQNPVGGSDWMAQQGLTATPQNKLAGLLGETAGMVGPAVVQAAAPKIAGGLLALDDKAMDMARQGIERRMVNSGMIQPATVWHGSPHKFDKFDSSKIGTGEGAQAYGHGLYLAESPDVAKQYAAEVSAAKRKITDRSGLFVNGQRIDMSDPSALLYAEIADKGAQQAIAERMSAIEKLIQQKGADYPLVKIKQKGLEQFKALAAKGGDVKRVTDVDVFQPSPQVYKVDLPDNAIARMLDWDKPLSQQAPEVQAALNKLPPDVKAHLGIGKYDDLKGGIDIVKPLGGLVGDAKVSPMLRQAGIPGIRHLDGGSRGAGQGSSNYVVFDDSLLKILERNGVPIK